MKKLALFFTFMWALCAGAHDFTVNNSDGKPIYYKIVDGDAVVTFSGSSATAVSNEYSGDLIVPSSVVYNSQSYTVIGIGQEAFKGCTSLTSIKIPSSVESFFTSAIDGTTGLRNLIILDGGYELLVSTDVSARTGLDSLYLGRPLSQDEEYQSSVSPFPSITKLGVGRNVDNLDDISFEGAKLVSINLPTTLYSVASGIFTDCKQLKSATIGVSTLSSYVFQGCSALESVKMTAATSILEGAFYECTSLKNVEFCNGVYFIADEVFSGCTSLTSMTIPSTVNQIGGSVFFGCTSLTTVVTSSRMESVTGNLFRGCTSLKNVTVAEGTKNIYRDSFYGCTSLESITLPSSLELLFTGAFRGCTKLKTLTISDSDKSLACYVGSYSNFFGHVFFQNTALDSVYIGRNISVGYSGSKADSPFYMLESLRSVCIGQKVDKITDDLFYGCTSLKNVDCRTTNLTEIGTEAFYSCQQLKELLLPNTLRKIGEYAFYDCRAAKNIVIPSSLSVVSSYSFAKCSSVDTLAIPANLKRIGQYAFEGLKIRELVIPSTLDTLENASFKGCSNLHKVTIDQSSKPLYMPISSQLRPFSGCSLDSVYIYRQLEFNTNTLSPFYGISSKLNYVKIGGANTEIKSYFFSNCSGLKRVELEPCVTKISMRAFERCRDLTSVNTGGVSTFEKLAFWESSSIDSVDVSGTSSLPESCFEGCTSLSKVKHASGLTIGPSAFSTTTSLTSFDFAGVTEIRGGAFGNSGLVNVALQPSLTTLEGSAFSYCESLESITFPTSIDSIPDGTCSGCVALTTINVPNNITKIGDNAFYECESLTSASLHPNVETLGQSVYEGCTSLTDATIPTKLKVIRNALFKECTSLASVVIPASVEQIDNYAFAGCGSLKKLAFEKGDKPLSIYAAHYSPTVGIYNPGGGPVVIPEEEGSFQPFYGCPVDTLLLGRNVTFTSDTTTAFEFFKNMRYVEIAANVTNIPAYTFKHDTNISQVRSYVSTPPTMGKNNFKGLTIYVPNGSVAAYEAADYWKDNTIVGFDAAAETTSKALAELTHLVDSAQAIYDNSVEGTAVGKYPVGSRADLLSVIQSVNAAIASTPSSSTIATCTSLIKAAIQLFLDDIIKVEDTDISQYNDIIYIDKVVSLRDREVKIPIKMKNSVSATGFQFDMQLPSGVTFAKDASNKVKLELATTRTSSSATDFFKGVVQSDGTLRVLAYSTSGATFSGSDGEIAYISVVISDTLSAGQYPIVLRNVEVTDASGTPVDVSLVKSTLEVSANKVGDTNGDNKVSVADLAAIAAHILGGSPASFDSASADINGDGQVNVADLAAAANIILYGTMTPPSGANVKSMLAASAQPIEISVGEFSIAAGGEATVAINVSNPSHSFSGFQFDIELPEGVSVKNSENGRPCAELSTERTTRDATDYFGSARMKDGSHRVLCFSTTNALFNGTSGAVALITLVADKSVSLGSYTLKVKNAEFTAYGNSISASDCESDYIVDNALSILSAEETGKAVNVHDVTGRELRHQVIINKALEGLPSGTYIVDGKKVVVK